MPPATCSHCRARWTRHDDACGIPESRLGQHTDDSQARAAWAEALAVLHEVDRVFSTYRQDSFVSRLGRGEVGLDDCPREVAEVLAVAEQARTESEGAFDLRRPDLLGDVLLDPSGVVKGWAVERAARAFDGLSDTDLCLSAGGDMVCRVADPDRPAWQVGVEDPRTWNRIVAVVPVRDGAVATSGLNRRGAHIVDARTLRWLATRPHRRGVVVWADGTSEVYATQRVRS